MTSKIPPKLTLDQAVELAVSLKLEPHQQLKLAAQCPEFFGWLAMQSALRSLPEASAKDRGDITRYVEGVTRSFVRDAWPGFVEHLRELGVLRRSEEVTKPGRLGETKLVRAKRLVTREGKAKPAGAGKPVTREGKAKPAGAGKPVTRERKTKPPRIGAPQPERVGKRKPGGI